MSNFFSLKFLYIFLVLVFVAGIKSERNKEQNESYCDGTGWALFKDEKCFKLIKKPLTLEEAKVACEQEGSHLVSIKSADEQEYLTEYIFNKSAVELNVWIGAKREETNAFVWDDGSAIDFSNWANDSPSGVTKRACVVLQSEFAGRTSKSFTTTVSGQWRDINCEQWNCVVCEKLQKWSIEKLQQTLLDTRKNLRESLEQVQNELSESKVELNNKIDDTRRNSIPVGFMYVQLPNEKTPTEIWPLMQWSDVSATYGGVFFRVDGGDAAAFGEVQEDNAPRIETIISGYHNSIVTKYSGHGKNISIPRSGWSDAFFTGSFYTDANNVYINYKHSTGEVRPRNMAIRIWKRIS